MLSLRRKIESGIEQGIARDSIFREYVENREDYEVTEQEADYAFQSMLGGGARSPLNAIMTLCYLMMEHPQWQQKLQAEVDIVVGADRLPTFEDIPNLPIVRAVVKEEVRYRTIVAELGIPHRLDEDDVYEGYFFAKGTVFPDQGHRSILMDKTAHPARWLDPGYPTYREPLTVHPDLQNFTPFGYGRCACPGYDFVERTLVIMVARLASGFNFEKPIDPATKEPAVIEIRYKPTPNPRRLPFACCIVSKGEKRAEIIQKEANNLKFHSRHMLLRRELTQSEDFHQNRDE
ncbi:cytochrome P450 [Stachybotrys elegans]|uniref:Cytochrome P450 n=1 Tax=Stachybotrys elegans TaxID=80388 RepID=A0A8K0SHX1_9HYPO|nr:cytochrome P450 [Stachybotrys elegans]